MSEPKFPKKLNACLNAILAEEWGFLDNPWPLYPTTRKFHRSELKPINNMHHMKEEVIGKIGAIGVFFFLTTLWNKVYFPGPYKAVEKGIALLYYLVSGDSMEAMSVFLPRSSFYEIYRTFFKTEKRLFEKEMTRCFANMFSTPEIRMRSAVWSNPRMFRHITLLLDGHDTRATYRETKAKMYSYKLKKSGLRTQVCIDINHMVLFVSKSAPCKDNNDGSMMVEMGLANKIHEMDCVGVDGGYTQHISTLLEREDSLDVRNFCFPIRKKPGQALDEHEALFNSEFAGFRSMIEATFGDLGRTFRKFNNKEAIRTTDKKEVNMMMRLCFLLMNVRNMSNSLNLEIQPHHMAWAEDGFDYPRKQSVLVQSQVATVQNRLESGAELLRLQEEFLGMDLSDEDEMI